MSTAVAEPKSDNVKIGEIVIKYEPISFGIADAKLAQLKAEYADLKADSKEGYESVRLAIANCRHHRVSVEETRVRLKAPALAYGRQCDSEAARITAELESIEKPLQTSKDAADAEAARVKKAKMDEIQRKLDEAAAIKRAAEEAKLKAERDAEESRLKAEAERLAEERRQLEIERAAQESAAKAEREKLAEERRLADEERARLAREEEARLAVARAEQEARDRAQRERVEAEQRAESERQAEEARKIAEERRQVEIEKQRIKEAEERRQASIRAEEEAKARVDRERAEREEWDRKQAELASRRAAMRPDLEKIHVWASAVNHVPFPELKSAEIALAMQVAAKDIADRLDALIEEISPK